MLLPAKRCESRILIMHRGVCCDRNTEINLCFDFWSQQDHIINFKEVGSFGNQIDSNFLQSILVGKVRNLFTFESASFYLNIDSILNLYEIFFTSNNFGIRQFWHQFQTNLPKKTTKLLYNCTDIVSNKFQISRSHTTINSVTFSKFMPNSAFQIKLSWSWQVCTLFLAHPYLLEMRVYLAE